MTHATTTRLVEWAIVRAESGVREVVPAGVGEHRAVTAVPRREHAVEQVDTGTNGVDQPRRVTHTHQVSDPIRRKLGDGRGQRRSHLIARLTDGQPADAVAIEPDGNGALRAV